MKPTITFFILLAAIFVSAQPVIPPSHALQTGTFIYSHADNLLLGSLSPGSAGANQAWDFSQYQEVNTTSQMNSTCPGNPNCTDFPAADLLVTLATPTGFQYSYMDFESNDLTTIGAKAVENGNTTFTIYDNPRFEQRYPITYLQTITDEWSERSVPPAYTTTGTLTATADAFGSLVTPTGTYPNTLRIKRILNMVTNVEGSPPISIMSESYSWISPNIKGVLLLISFNQVTIEGFPPQETRSFAFGDNGALATSEFDLDKSVEVYPNPSSDFINLKSKEEIARVLVQNLEGKTLKIEKSSKIDIKDLPAGIYLISIELKNGNKVSKKIVKK